MLCGIVLPFKEFLSKGCPNCESVLKFLDEDESVAKYCTSPSFEGIVALCEPSKSWVGKWLRDDKFTPGLYAVKVNGKLPGDTILTLREQGIVYRARDGSAAD